MAGQRLTSAIGGRWAATLDMLDALIAGCLLIGQMARRRRLGLVLLYHRIAPSAGDPDAELVPAVSASTFRRQMRWLPLFFRVVPARELPTAITIGRRAWHRVPIAVTFDDESPDHVESALPILAQARVRATFFFTGLCLDGPRATWWELLQGATDAEMALDRLLGEGDIHARADRVKMMKPHERDAVISELERIGVKGSMRSMTSEELLATAAEHDVGFHTLRHDFLPALSTPDLNRAMIEGRETLEHAVGRRLDLISYPHGGTGRRVAAAARRAGYRLGFTTAETAWAPTMDPLQIGRIEVEEESVGSLVRRLATILVSTGSQVAVGPMKGRSAGPWKGPLSR